MSDQGARAGEGPAETQDSTRSPRSSRMTVAVTDVYVQEELSRVTQKLYRHIQPMNMKRKPTKCKALKLEPRMGNADKKTEL